MDNAAVVDSMTTAVLVLGSLLFAFLFFNPRLLKATFWRATVTPLASIIGSGFLVAGPILAHIAGTRAWLAMLALCATGYLFGAAIRHNIRHVEPTLHKEATALTLGLERSSELALSFAYFVSVAYYLNLFAAFGLRFGEVIDPFWIRIAATSAIAAIGLVGTFGGLSGLERLEVGVVGLKLCIIGGLFAALALGSFFAIRHGTFAWQNTAQFEANHGIATLMGLVILVQGFETSRYLGDKYEAEQRVRSMRWAQGIATAIYIVFILLITAYFTNSLPDEGGETAILDMLRPLGVATAPMLILVALASQLSAAVADMNGAGGLLSELSRQHLPVHLGNLMTALVAIAITWTADIYEIITYGSKAFVAYYALQSAQAALSAWRREQRGAAALYAAAVVLAVAVLLFAVPASA